MGFYEGFLYEIFVIMNNGVITIIIYTTTIFAIVPILRLRSIIVIIVRRTFWSLSDVSMIIISSNINIVICLSDMVILGSIGL